jgi:tripartite-type tricarboxylate transporter receptor subunit TctC
MPYPGVTRHAAAAVALSTFVLAAGRAGAEPYPTTNKITLIVAFAPGGIADTLVRLTLKA